MDRGVNKPWTVQQGNITRVVAVDLSEGDYEPGMPFFIRAGVEGVIKYCPWGNEDSEAITKNFAASDIFVDPEQCRKIFDLGTVSPAQAEDIYVGFGV
jgi:hypothetical protein